jgi:NAD(P)-dependent dehydrogenase (short-subunit alcohol dehydrogenase family)
VTSQAIAQRQAGRAAVVTGAARGIGRAIAERLLAEGASVLLVDADGDEAARAAQELAAGDRAAAYSADIALRQDVCQAFDACVSRFGALDILIANAAIADGVPLLQLSDKAWQRMLDVNLTGTFHCIQEAARRMESRHGGAIVVTSSTNSFWPEANTAHYSASKAGLVALVKTAALELAAHRIRVNAVAPGIVRTRLTRFLIDDPVEGAEYLKRIPLGRYAEPADIAAAVAFLASSDADYITGEELVVDGGVTVGVPIEPPGEPLPGAMR